MRVAQPILVALALAGCGSAPPRAAPAPAPVVEAEHALPIVQFRLLIIRSWSDPYFIVETEDRDLTLPEALEMGLPAELWIRCAIENPVGFRQEIYYVRKLRC